MGSPREEWSGATPEDMLKLLAPYVIEYIEWYCENGIHLPEDHERDPGGYTLRLREIQNAFEMIEDDRVPQQEGKKKTEFENGIKLFHKYFEHLWR